MPEFQGHHLVLTVLYVPHSLDSGDERRRLETLSRIARLLNCPPWDCCAPTRHFSLCSKVRQTNSGVNLTLCNGRQSTAGQDFWLKSTPTETVNFRIQKSPRGSLNSEVDCLCWGLKNPGWQRNPLKSALPLRDGCAPTGCFLTLQQGWTHEF